MTIVVKNKPVIRHHFITRSTNMCSSRVGPLKNKTIQVLFLCAPRVTTRDMHRECASVHYGLTIIFQVTEISLVILNTILYIFQVQLASL